MAVTIKIKHISHPISLPEELRCLEPYAQNATIFTLSRFLSQLVYLRVSQRVFLCALVRARDSRLEETLTDYPETTRNLAKPRDLLTQPEVPRSQIPAEPYAWPSIAPSRRTLQGYQDRYQNGLRRGSEYARLDEALDRVAQQRQLDQLAPNHFRSLYNVSHQALYAYHRSCSSYPS